MGQDEHTADNHLPAAERSQVADLAHQNALLRRRVERLERQLASITAVIDQVRNLGFWDYTPYDVVPDDTWLAVDRVRAGSLMSALAGVDHWDPWGTSIEPRPQP